MDILTDIEKQAIGGALNKYLELEGLPEELRTASESAKEKIKNGLKKKYLNNILSIRETKVVKSIYNVAFCSECSGSVWQVEPDSKYCFRCGAKLNWN